MRRGFVILFWLTVLAIAAPSAPAADPSASARIFDIAGRPAHQALALVEGAVPPGHIPDSLMLRQLVGIIDVLSSRDIGSLRRAVVKQTRVPDTVEIRECLAVVHLMDRGGESARVEIARVEHGWIMARSSELSLSVRLDEGVIRHLLARWLKPLPRPMSAAEDIEPAVAANLAHPYTPSPIILDEPTVSGRFSRGGVPLFSEPLSRNLADEQFVVRRPVGHDPRRPVGLLVWVSPTDNADPPDSLIPAVDEIGLIYISPVNAGNDRVAVDRLQLTLDAVSTASARWWIDTDRVYISGMSGGGRIASMLWSCFPDIFSGGVGVVGMNSHHRVEVGDGRYWPRNYRRPVGTVGRLISGHRFAAISGPHDYNFKEIRGRVRLLRRDGLPVRMFDFADHKHAMSTPGQFRQALAWVDEPWRARQAELTEKADKLMSLYLDRYGHTAPPDDRAERLLERITIVGPWSEPAWRAAELLGFVPESAAEPAP